MTRIFPTFLFCLVLSAFVIGALYTTLPPSDYLRNPDVLGYVTQNLKLQTTMVWDLPGVFTHTRYVLGVNGSIWTLTAEFRMCLWVVIGVLVILSRRWICSLLLAVMFACAVFQPDHLLWMSVHAFLHLGGYFAVGAICYIQREKVPTGWVYVAAFALMAYLLRSTVVYPFAFGAELTAFVSAFAYCIP